MPKKSLMWIHYFGILMTKAVYGYLFYQNFRTNVDVNTYFDTILYAFMVIGLTMAMIGVILARSGKNSKLSRFLLPFFENSSKKISSDYMKMILSLGFTEIPAVLGLAGYIMSSVPLFFYIMIGMSVAGWLAAIPLERAETENLDQLD